jgi:SAM-dependent methyltransferase
MSREVVAGRHWTESPVGATWTERAALHPLQAVISPLRSVAENRAIDAIERHGLRRLVDWRRRFRRTIDFGCGTGRFLPLLRACSDEVWGLEVTPAMLAHAEARYGGDRRIHLRAMAGGALPAELLPVDQIFCSAVLRGIRQNDAARFEALAGEFYEALEPGGRLVILEMYMDLALDVYLRPFKEAGFTVRVARAIHHSGSRAVRWIARWRWLPPAAWMLAEREIRRAARRERWSPADYVVELNKPLGVDRGSGV